MMHWVQLLVCSTRPVFGFGKTQIVGLDAGAYSYVQVHKATMTLFSHMC